MVYLRPEADNTALHLQLRFYRSLLHLTPAFVPEMCVFWGIDVTVENEAFSGERASAYDLGKVVSERALRSVEWSAIYNS